MCPGTRMLVSDSDSTRSNFCQ
uniref:Uncharacterized protein n=1 Tax=Anguilla anguilla TaxID=7936 RepID=A0A0E9U076_ANGAN